MKKIKNKEKGYNGEQIAKNYLEKKQYKIIKQNFYSKHGEIDIIVEKENIITFVEVKNYKKNSLKHPLFAITERKKRNLRYTAQLYIIKNEKMNQKMCKFDVIIVEEGKVIEHLENAL